MKKIYIFLLFFNVMSLHKGYSQFDNAATNLPPSSNATSILGQISTPVNLYNGIPLIQANLHNLQARGSYGIPIALAYKSGGIKVQDVAGTVGLGWSLSANCLISRVVRGLADESDHGYFGSDMGNRINTTPDLATLEGIRNGELDAEPDLFFYNINGLSGKFVFDKDKNAIMLNDKSIKVLNSPFRKELGFDYWVLSDLYGNKFYFGMDQSSIEETSSIHYGQSTNKTQNYTSSWYLRKIALSNDTEIIDYNYEAGLPTKTTYYNRTMRSTDKFTVKTKDEIYFLGIRIRKGSKTSTAETVDINEWDNNIEQTTVSPKYLKSIISSDQSVFFGYDQTPREDLVNGRILNKISFKSYTGELLRDYILNYKYVSEIDEDLPWNAPVNRADNFRLLLNNIELCPGGIETAKLQVYGFEYDSKFNLPPRYSRRVDHWGYFNNNIYGYFPDNNESQKLSKDPDESRTKANLLQKITYQTGGYKKFIYEPNRYYNVKEQRDINVGGVRVKQVESVPNENDDYLLEMYDYNDNQSHSSGKLTNSNPIYITYISNSHTNSNAQKRIYFPKTGSSSNPIQIPPVPGSLVDDFAGTGQLINPSFVPQVPVNGLALNLIYNTSKSLFKLFEGASVNVYYGPTKIRSFNTINNLFDLNGSVIGYSQVSTYSGGAGKTTYLFTDTDDYPDLSAQFSIDNNFVAYNRLGPDEFPFTPSTSYAFARGKIKEKRDYDNYGVLVNKVTNKYEFNDDSRVIKGFKCETAAINTIDGSYVSKNNNFFSIGYYDMISKSHQLKETVVENFIKDNPSPIKKTVLYQYNNSYPSLLTSENIQNSDGVNFLSEYKYVFDKNQVAYNSPSESQAASALFDDNKLAILLEQTLKRNGEVITTKKTGFKKWTVNNKQLVLPETVYQGIGANIEPQIQFDAYNEYGSILQSARHKDVKNVTVWGYKGLYPIAQFSNVTLADIFYENFENNQNSNIVTGAAHSGNKLFVGDFVPGFNADVNKTYKISYWYRLNTDWHFSGYMPYSGASMVLDLGDAIDDVIIMPVDATISVSDYHPSVGVISSTDTKGLMTHYEYDNLQRLRFVKDQNKNIVKSICYNYTGQEVDCSWTPVVYKSKEISRPFKRNNCIQGYSRTEEVQYIVPFGRYTSTISQADANRQALEDINNKGQVYANESGECIKDVYAKLKYENITIQVIEGSETSDEILEEHRGDVKVYFYDDLSMTTPSVARGIALEFNVDPAANIYPAISSPARAVIDDGSLSFLLLKNVPIKLEKFERDANGQFQRVSSLNYNYNLKAQQGIVILN